MNTKHTRVVVTLFLAVATLATMGFSTTFGYSRAASVLPAAETCELPAPGLTVYDLLELVDDPCFADMIPSVETEIDRGFYSDTSIQVLVNDILERSQATGTFPFDLVEASATEAEVPANRSVLASSVSTSRDEWSLSETDIAEMELDRGLESTLSGGALVESILARSRATAANVDLLELSEIEAEAARLSTDLSAQGVGGRVSLVTLSDLAGFTSDLSVRGIGLRARLVTEDDLGVHPRETLVTEDDLAAQGIYGRTSLVTKDALGFDGAIDYHNPSSPWADSDQVGGARSASRFEGLIDYHNPSSPWADSDQVGGARSAPRFEGRIDYHNPGAPDW